jgi:hypothetical protein
LEVEVLDEHQLGEYIDEHFKSRLFRLETLEQYTVGAEDEDFHRYLAGEPGPTSKWHEVIRGEVARGLYTYRVHVVRSPLSDYLRYECEWGYTSSVVAGEQIRIIDTAERHKPDVVPDEDFWLIGDEQLVLMHYNPDGTFRGGSIGPPELVPRYVAAREAAWSAGEDFTDYWRRHPEYHRDHSVT